METVLASISDGRVLSLELEQGGILPPSLLLKRPGQFDDEPDHVVISLLPEDAIWLIKALADALPFVLNPDLG